MTCKIRLIDKDNEIDAFRELFESVFEKKMTTKFWRWKYLENPIMPNQPLIYIAEHERRMVGARSLLPTRMKFGNTILNGIQLCDTMVHPNYRRMGLFTKMNRCAIEDARKRGFSLFYGFPSQMLGKIYKNRKSLGWQLVSKKILSLKIFSPKKVASSQISNKALDKITGMALRLLSTRKSKLPSMTTEKSYDITEEKLITEEFCELWKSSSSDFKICTVRNKEYMEWRFIRHPENDYRFFIARKNKEPLGYFVTNIAENHNLVEGRIIDYIIKDDGGKEVFLSLLLEILERFRKAECDLVSTWAFTQPEFQQVLNRCGFVKASSFPYNIFSHEYYFGVITQASNFFPVDPLKKTNWYITQADADTY